MKASASRSKPATPAPRWVVTTQINVGKGESYFLLAPDGSVVAQAKNGNDTRLREIALACNHYPGVARMLKRLAEKVKRANSIQHSGGKIDAEDWSELFQLVNEAEGVLDGAAS